MFLHVTETVNLYQLYLTADDCKMAATKKSQKSKKNSLPDRNHDLASKADKVSTANNDEILEGIADAEQEEEVKCFCGDKREFGEMVECEICSGWFHLKCLRMKEGIGLLEGKQFVCNFCLSSKVLELTRVVIDLQREVKELREAVKNGRQVSDDEVTKTDGENNKWKVVKRKKGSPKVAETGDVKANPKVLKRPKNGGKKVSSGEGVSLKANHGEKESFVRKNGQGLYVGARKLWGTKRKVSEEMVRERLREKYENAEKVDVVRVDREDNRGTRWWFWLKGDESVLSDLDNVVLDEHWKVQKKSPFLDVAIVRVLDR